jgi:hypothetical protein
LDITSGGFVAENSRRPDPFGDRPFEESIIEVLLDINWSNDITFLAVLIKRTAIRFNHKLILRAWEQAKTAGFVPDEDHGVTDYIEEQRELYERPFEESLVQTLSEAQATTDLMPIADVIKRTELRYNYDLILFAWEHAKEEVHFPPNDYGVTEYVENERRLHADKNPGQDSPEIKRAVRVAYRPFAMVDGTRSCSECALRVCCSCSHC